MIAFELFQTIFEPAKVTEHSSTLLDNLFTNFEHRSSSVTVSAISDHHGQLVKLKFGVINKKRTFIIKENFLKLKT